MILIGRIRFRISDGLLLLVLIVVRITIGVIVPDTLREFIQGPVIDVFALIFLVTHVVYEIVLLVTISHDIVLDVSLLLFLLESQLLEGTVKWVHSF